MKQTPMKQTPTSKQRRVNGVHAGLPVNPGIDDNGFAVVIEKVIGRVEFGKGEHAPHEAAFLLIANAGEDGTFRFPGPAEGVTVEVVVNTIDTTGRT